MAKYAPLQAWLTGLRESAAEVRFHELETIVGRLPMSARTYRPWWGNARYHPHSLAWIEAGWVVDAVDLDEERVRFVRGEPNTRCRPSGGRDVVLDGTLALEDFVMRAGYETVEAAVAEHAIFLHPDTVRQTDGRALFPVVRDMTKRGEIGTDRDGRTVMFCDNTTPKDAYLWSADMVVGPDTQLNHVWSDSRDPEIFTALWNLCFTPAFLAKATDSHGGVQQALRYRSYELFGFVPGRNEPAPEKPDGYDGLRWGAMPDPAADLEKRLRRRLNAGPKRRAAVAARTIGWLYSDGPDTTITGPH